MRITTESALAHIEQLYELSGIDKIISGDFACLGWNPCPPEEAAKDLACDLEAVDAIRAKICELAEEDDSYLPNPELILDDCYVSFDSYTSLYEPQAWIYLKDKTSVEITHEESGLDLKDQYFSVRHHCSEEDFENDVYHSTMGVIEQCSGGLASIAGMLERIVKESGIEEPSDICPICGAHTQKSRHEDWMDYNLCCDKCGCKTSIESTNTGISISDNNGVFVSVSDQSRYSNTEKYLMLGCTQPGEMMHYFTKPLEFGHSASMEELRNIAAAGYFAASEMYKRHNCAKIEAEAEELFNAALNKSPTESQSGGSSLILLREVEDGELYGVLLADGPDDAELTSAFLSAKEAVAKSDPEWQVGDILARLPKEWNARVEMPGSIYI